MLRVVLIKDLAITRGERRLFSNLDLTLAAGEAAVLVGRNGAGKTSLLRAVAGLLRPAEGTIAFEGEAEQEVGRVTKVEPVNGEMLAKCKPGDVIVRVDPRYFRPTEVETLLGDPSKAKQKLGWVPKITLPELVKEMVEADYTAARRDSLVKMAGFQAYDYNE